MKETSSNILFWFFSITFILFLLAIMIFRSPTEILIENLMAAKFALAAILFAAFGVFLAAMFEWGWDS